jgi:apolipoprotein N-acyltransferase
MGGTQTLERLTSSVEQQTSKSVLYLARVVSGILLAALSVLLLTLALPRYAVWPLVLVALVPMLVAQHRLLPQLLAGIAPAITFSWFLFDQTSRQIARLPGSIVAWIVIIGALLLPLGWLDRRLHTATNYRWFVVAAPLVVVGSGALFPNSPLHPTDTYLAYAFYAHPNVVQPVSVFSTNALNLLIWCSNFAIASWLIGHVGRRTSLSWCLGIGVVWIAWCVFGFALMGSSTPTVRVAAVQTTSDYVVPGTNESSSGLQPMAEMTTKAASEGAKLVVWHEGQLYARPGDEKSVLVPVQNIARSDHVYLVVGLVQPGLDQAVTIDPAGQILGFYGKQHPVTFLGEKSHPTPVYVYKTTFGPLATIICYDLNYLDTAREAAVRGARILAVPSQELIHPPGKGDPLQYTLAVFRAVENHVSIVKADGGYDSAIVDPYGRIVSDVVSTSRRDALVVAAVPIGSGKAPDQTIEPWFTAFAGLLGVFLYCAMLAQMLRHRRSLRFVSEEMSPRH